MRCQRHPSVETALSCGRCETPICPHCLVHSDVGIRCRKCAPPLPWWRRPRNVYAGSGTLVTGALVGLLAFQFLGGGFSSGGPQIPDIQVTTLLESASLLPGTQPMLALRESDCELRFEAGVMDCEGSVENVSMEDLSDLQVVLRPDGTADVFRLPIEPDPLPAGAVAEWRGQLPISLAVRVSFEYPDGQLAAADRR